MRPIQFFPQEYLKQCKKMSLKDRLRFLEDFRNLQDVRPPSKTKLISLRIDESILEKLKLRAKGLGKPYQTLLKEILRDSLIT